MRLLFASTSYLVKDDMVPYGETRKKEREFTIYNTVIQNICPGHNQVFNNALLNLLKTATERYRIYVYDMWIANTAMLYGKIIFSNQSLTYYRQHEGNLMGTSKSTYGKLLKSFKRLMSGDGKKTRKQIQYFLEENEQKLREEGCYDEIRIFLESKTFFQRLIYVSRSKLYRQTKLETVSFKFAVLSGKY